MKRTRESLQRALIEVAVEVGYDNVSVQNVLDRANVVRSTFYSHFRDKNDLLESSLVNLKAGMLHQWRLRLEHGESKGELGFVLPLLQHVDGGRHLWKALVIGESGRIVDRNFRSMIADLTRRDLGLKQPVGIEEAATIAFVVGALMYVIEGWMLGTISGTATEVNQRFLSLALPGLTQTSTLRLRKSAI